MSNHNEDVLHEDSITESENTTPDHQQVPPKKLRRYDSLDIEAGKLSQGEHHNKDQGWMVVLQLAFQSLGVVYGDIGTSPLYVYSSVFTDGIRHKDDVIGVLGLILYTITLIPLLKYVLIVLKANDNGDGGTFALYSLICRYVNVGLIPSQEKEDQDVSTFRLALPNKKNQRGSKIQSSLENSKSAKFTLLLATMLGTCMLIGDGVLTPCISVLSAVGGIKAATSAVTNDVIVWTSVGILVLLFSIQRFGTDKVGYSFAPIILVWFILISGIGLYNFIIHDPSVIMALYPKYIFDYFRRNKKEAWISLGGVVLSITGTEALFADVGHFSVKSIQISTCTVVYPALVLQYSGQAAYLRKNSQHVADAFYKSVPGPIYWPMFVVAVLSSVIASQALISGTFSIIQQSLSQGCFPRVKVVHTSAKYPGQVYVPEVNFLLMIACICVTLGFRDTIQIGNAYGIAVVFVMALTSAFLVLIMTVIWKTHISLVIAYVLTIGVVELVYLSSVLYKFDQGGYLPIAFALHLMAIMYTWNYTYRKKYYFELENKISSEQVEEIIEDSGSQRITGLAIFYSELVHGIPPIFKHYVGNVPALHSVLVFVSIKSLPISKVPSDERFLFRRVQPNDLQVFRCVARYGYKDVRCEEESFECLLIESLRSFVNNEIDRDDLEGLDQACQAGVVHLVGEHDIVARKGGGIGNSVLIDYGYNFLKKNLVQTNKLFDIPHQKMLKVGMIYEL